MTTRFERAFALALGYNAKPPKGTHKRLKARLKRQADRPVYTHLGLRRKPCASSSSGRHGGTSRDK